MQLPTDVTLRAGTLEDELLERSRAWLTEEERRRYEKYGSRSRARQFQLGRGLVRELLADRFRVAPADIRVRTDEDGAPRVADRPDCRISIAHSGERAVAVAARRSVGVDLERIQTRRDDLYRAFLAPDEYELLDALCTDENGDARGDAMAAQILCWTLKESALKARGTGLRVSPKTLRIVLEETGAARVRDREGAGSWTVRYERRDDYLLSIAYPV